MDKTPIALRFLIYFFRSYSVFDVAEAIFFVLACNDSET